jgi:hypothetical protein
VLASSHRPMMPRCAASILEYLSARWPEYVQSNQNHWQHGFASMASSVDAIHGSGPVMRRPSMDRRASGLSVIFACVSPRVLALHTESPVGTFTRYSAAWRLVSLRSRAMRGGEVGTSFQKERAISLQLTTLSSDFTTVFHLSFCDDILLLPTPFAFSLDFSRIVNSK